MKVICLELTMKSNMFGTIRILTESKWNDL